MSPKKMSTKTISTKKSLPTTIFHHKKNFNKNRFLRRKMLPEENVAKKIFAEKFSSSKFFFAKRAFLSLNTIYR